MMRLTTATYTEPLPQPEVGACPAGYRESVGFRPAGERRRRCPSARSVSLELDAERGILRRDAARRPPSESAVTGCRRSGAESM
jgi:hypothetical protein